jgi:Protein of unknown function (DUF3833)
MKHIVNLLIIFSFLTSCASVKAPDYAQEKPVLDLAQYFNGTIDAWGMFQDRSGKVIKRFTVVIDAKWNGSEGTLDEDFTYSDGTKDRRVWTITKLDANHYSGTAGDVDGTAQGEAYGNALNWRYVLKLKVDNSIYHVNFNDWMYLMDDKVMLNRAEMNKFGFKLGEVTLSFRKR